MTGKCHMTDSKLTSRYFSATGSFIQHTKSVFFKTNKKVNRNETISD